LTLFQPYAWLVAAGHKPIENRSKTFNKKGFRGPFWIHTSRRTRFKDDEWQALWREVRGMCDKFLGESFVLPELGALSYGSIIGYATITGILVPKDQLFHRPNVPWHFPDQYGFVVENAVLLEKPVPCLGALGFWKVPAPVLEELRSVA